MKVYISGAMAGLDSSSQEKFFRGEAARAELRGWKTVVPHDCPPDHRSHDESEPCPRSYSPSGKCFLRGDLVELLKCDAIVMVGEWHESEGAPREHDVAIWTGIRIYYSVEALPAIWDVK